MLLPCFFLNIITSASARSPTGLRKLDQAYAECLHAGYHRLRPPEPETRTPWSTDLVVADHGTSQWLEISEASFPLAGNMLSTKRIKMSSLFESSTYVVGTEAHRLGATSPLV